MLFHGAMSAAHFMFENLNNQDSLHAYYRIQVPKQLAEKITSKCPYDTSRAINKNIISVGDQNCDLHDAQLRRLVSDLIQHDEKTHGQPPIQLRRRNHRKTDCKFTLAASEYSELLGQTLEAHDKSSDDVVKTAGLA